MAILTLKLADAILKLSILVEHQQLCKSRLTVINLGLRPKRQPSQGGRPQYVAPTSRIDYCTNHASDQHELILDDFAARKTVMQFNISKICIG